MKTYIINLFLISLLFSSCSSLNIFSTTSRSDLYRDNFLQRIDKIKEQYRLGKTKIAMASLRRMNNLKLRPTENALKRNLMGVIQFSQKKYNKALSNFNHGLELAYDDDALTSQIKLNIASCFFKLNKMERAFSVLEDCDYRLFNISELKKYHFLRYQVAKALNNRDEIVISLIKFLSDKKKLDDLKSDQYFERLYSAFFKLDHDQRMNFLEDFSGTEYLCVGHLAYLEAEKLYYGGQKESAKDLLEWITEEFGHSNDLLGLVKNFLFRLENYLKIDTSAIGIVLPLTGDKSKFGKRALLGIDCKFRQVINNLSKNKKYRLYIRDSKGSGAVGSYMVKELIEKHYVSAIIGGLFSSEATKEYLEAKKHGSFFISLSQIYLPREEKDHLLLEIPGSIESQVEQLFSNKIFQTFGNRAAIFYPDSARGKAYVSEFWRKAKLKDIEVTALLSYDPHRTDYRPQIKNILGLKYIRERQEEYDLLSEINSLEKNRPVRRVQVLRPSINFDWLFLPAYPREALQIIPSFSYFDAFRLNIVGGPSWRSRALSDESYKLGRLYFIGDDLASFGDKFSKYFIKSYGMPPKLIEMRAYDTFKILSVLLNNASFTTRDEFDIFLRGIDKLKGITGNWIQKDGIWLKEMSLFKLYHGKIEKF